MHRYLERTPRRLLHPLPPSQATHSLPLARDIRRRHRAAKCVVVFIAIRRPQCDQQVSICIFPIRRQRSLPVSAKDWLLAIDSKKMISPRPLLWRVETSTTSCRESILHRRKAVRRTETDQTGSISLSRRSNPSARRGWSPSFVRPRRATVIASTYVGDRPYKSAALWSAG